MKALIPAKRILTFEEIDEIHEQIEKRLKVLGRVEPNRCKGDSPQEEVNGFFLKEGVMLRDAPNRTQQ